MYLYLDTTNQFTEIKISLYNVVTAGTEYVTSLLEGMANARALSRLVDVTCFKFFVLVHAYFSRYFPSPF